MTLISFLNSSINIIYIISEVLITLYNNKIIIFLLFITVLININKNLKEHKNGLITNKL